MKVKRFTAANMQIALRMVSQELGADAVILSSKKVNDGIEVVAALDYHSEQDAGSPEIERQLRLQSELEEAKQASREAVNEHPQRQRRTEFASRSDVSSREGLEAVLNGLKNDSFSTPPAAEKPASTPAAAHEATMIP